MTTTSLLPHKPPPLKTRNPVFLRSNYYGSVGRPSNGEWKRKSAVELLQESKAFYVKSESVLDTKQELKNAEHLHVRSPTVDVSLLRGTNPNNVVGPFPFAMCPTCPPYPHQHFDHFHLHSTVQHHVHFTTSTNGGGTTVIGATNNKTKGKDQQQTPNNKSGSQRTRRSVQPPGTLPLPLQLHIQMQKDMSLLSGGGERENIHRTSVPNNIIGLPPLAFPLATISSSLPRGSCIDKSAPALPLHSQQQIISSTTTIVPTIPNHGKRNETHRDREEDDSPPPLPPKSPRTTTKPTRPQDFPQRLQGPNLSSSGNDSSMQPPPPPRRLSSQGDNDHHHSEAHTKLRRLLQDPLGKGLVDASVPLTLPSPILPPTPPPDIVMESPMSDSGPIISPPPAFSTPVTPMLDRQNSSASDRSLRQTSQKHHPLSAAMSVVSINVSVSSMSTRSRKSVPDLSDVSMRYSPRSRSRSQSRSPRSSSSAISPEGDTGVGGGGSSSSPGADADNEPEDDVDDVNGGDNDGDDDSSGIREPVSLPSNSRVLISSSKKLPIPKSVTENVLCKVGATENPNNNTNSSTQTPLTTSISNDVKGTTTTTPSVVTPQRRPILRSKSDLSHRYMKSVGALGQGFTLVHVDLGLPPPPPLPLHNSISSTDFRTSVHRNHHYSNHQGYSHTFSHNHSHHHHHHQHHYSYPYPPYPHHPHGTSHQQKLQLGNHGQQQSHYQHPVPQPQYYSHTLDAKRPSRTSSELERFFDMLGLDNTVTATEAPPPCPLSQLTRTKSGSSSPVFFSSVSSVDSVPRRGGSVDSGDSPVGVKIGSRTVGGGGYNAQNNNGGPTIVVQHGEPSIVERNARVIKWLFNCRKATDKR